MKEDKRLKRKVRNSYIISTISIALVLLLLGSVSYMAWTALDIAADLREGISATIELKSDVGERRREQIRREIAAYPLVSEVSFISKEEKLADEEFRALFGVEFEDILTENPLLDSFEARLSSAAADRAELEHAAAKIGSMQGVERVIYPALLIEQVHSSVDTFQLVIMIFGGALLFISLVLLSNTIRLAIYSRRYIINTMKLVGATRWFIVRPFLWSGIVSGFWAGVLAAAMLLGASYALQESIPELLSQSELERIGLISAVMIASGIVISSMFTSFAVNKFVSMNSSKIHLY
ncbi:MAG: permease-like cell division protein FtsX [Rikenellaceae bacterium]